MKKRKVLILSGVVVLFGVLFAMTLVGAKATKTAVSGTYSSIIVGEPERSWIDDEGILHLRRMPTLITFPAPGYTGDLVGTATGISNFNLTWPSGTGDGTSFWTLNVSWRGLSGTFEGRFTADIIEHWAEAEAILHGTAGDFVGMKMLLNIHGGGFETPLEFEGIVLDPHGE